MRRDLFFIGVGHDVVVMLLDVSRGFLVIDVDGFALLDLLWRGEKEAWFDRSTRQWTAIVGLEPAVVLLIIFFRKFAKDFLPAAIFKVSVFCKGRQN